MAKVTIYTKDYCPYCTRAKALFDMKKVPYTEIDITHDPELQNEVVQKSGGRRTVPQIFINDKPIGGFDDANTLNQQGKLDILLGK
ncbi:MAG: glutaredoxin 3 [Hyphomicrobiales bacterium]|nr:glutaredoxin 3 [Hyphomicrobiales bacterium]